MSSKRRNWMLIVVIVVFVVIVRVTSVPERDFSPLLDRDSPQVIVPVNFEFGRSPSQLRGLGVDLWWVDVETTKLVDKVALVTSARRENVGAEITSLLLTYPEQPMLLYLHGEDSNLAAQAVCEIVNKDSVGRLLVGANHTALLARVRKLCPSVSTWGSPRELAQYHSLDWLGVSPMFDSPAVALVEQFSAHETDGAFVQKAREIGVSIILTGIDSAAAARVAIRANPQGIVTTNPQEILQELGRL